jgi:tRNA pseudouridine38-40 synthase
LDTGRFHDVFHRKTACHLPQVFDIEAMRQAAQLFIGSHDFRSFTKLHSKTKSTVRTITTIDIEAKAPFVTIRLRGNGFLYKMARLMVGALIAVGEHSMGIEELTAILELKNKNNPLQPAPPHGLCLESVTY